MELPRWGAPLFLHDAERVVKGWLSPKAGTLGKITFVVRYGKAERLDKPAQHSLSLTFKRGRWENL